MKDLTAHTGTLRELAALLHKHGLSELRFSSGELHIRLRREPMESETVVQTPVTLREAVEVPEQAPAGEAIEAPFAGVFYRAARPEEPAFVELGDLVDEGQVICLLEANKVFSEITSPFSGVITDISHESGAVVQQGEPLFYILPSSQGA